MSRLPDLGPRGEGWVVLQGVFFVAIAASGLLPPAWSGPLRVVTTAVGGFLVAGGVALAVLGVRDLGGSLTALPHPRDDAPLVETGVYGRARHPIYGGLILGAVGWGLACASPIGLLLALALFGFFVLKSSREEAWLAERYPAYPAYRSRTHRFIPYVG